MQRITLAGRLIITLVVVAAVYFGFRYFVGNKAAAPVTATTAPVSPGAAPGTEASGDYSTTESGSSTSTQTSSSATAAAPAFTYEAPAPVNGKLKGVVELGASGFNSFIVRIDKSRNWKLEKAEFGNSLVMENMSSDDDVRKGLKAYIGQMLDYGVSGRDIHFVVSSGAIKASGTAKIIKALKDLNYVVNTVTPEKEGVLGLRSVLPASFADKSFVTDIGSGNTKITWMSGGAPKSVETYGAKYFQDNVDDATVAADVKAKANQVPQNLRQTCFIIGGVPFEMAKKVRNGKERYTVLQAADAYQLDNAKSKAGLNIYKSIAEATGCKQFVFDWDANFTIGYLLTLPQ
ncbi:hypothetical protein [Hymenobacter cellulosivorans]|uniref:Ppx/GppA phosphatase domain-containing protein n=1 Tax=Hymenobacter cellulosivorans TaxID=2932249 RepID=A0ABY4FEB8_9BACT|nr:hypothetical protein [Hymenobacter cellulosivorans]UOQ55029.1 hypothetical protein MUN80_09790 [Hymenobacter cellulosivorans]